MIRTLHIQNYRCLRDVTLELEPLTVLVGGNASGKSSVISAMLRQFAPEDAWRRDRTRHITVALLNADGSGITFDQSRGSSGNAPWPTIQSLQFELGRLRAHNTLQTAHQLSHDGLGLANVFATLPRRTRDEVSRRFCTSLPNYADIDSRPSSPGNHRIVFQDRWDANVWYEPEQVSDGTMLMLAFELLPYQTPAPDLIAIEEPERGLHPFLMGELITALRRLAQPLDGRPPIQVLLATHSADLLEFIDPKEIRFLHRNRDTGATEVKTAPVANPNWPALLREYDDSLGNLWKSGGLGGVPGG